MVELRSVPVAVDGEPRWGHREGDAIVLDDVRRTPEADATHPLTSPPAEAASSVLQGQLAPAAVTPVPSTERQREGRMENINYVALAVCMAVSNGWFFLSVMKFT